MMASVLGLIFAALAILLWDDEGFRRLHILLANIWWAAAFIAHRLEQK